MWKVAVSVEHLLGTFNTRKYKKCKDTSEIFILSISLYIAKEGRYSVNTGKLSSRVSVPVPWNGSYQVQQEESWGQEGWSGGEDVKAQM